MSWGEFTTLLCGVSENTALGKIVAIRAEKDPKVIKSFSKEQKRVYNKWRNRNAKKVDMKEYNTAMDNFKNMFIAFSKI